MRRLFRLGGVMFCAAMLGITLGPRSGCAAEVGQEVDRIFADGWNTLPTTWETSKRLYETAIENTQADSRLDFALALVALKHARFDESRALLASATSGSPPLVAAWRARVYITLYRKKYSEALGELEAWQAAWSKLYPAPGAAAADAAFLGSFCGFFAGPLGAAVESDRLAKIEAKFTELFSPPEKMAYDAARKSLLENYHARRSDLATAKTQATADQEQARQSQREFNAKEIERLQKEIAMLATQQEEAKAAADSRVMALTQSLEPLTKRYTELLEQAKPLVSNIRELRDDISKATAAARLERLKKGGDPGRFEQIGRDRNRDLDRELARLKPLEDEGKKVQDQGQKLEAERGKAIAEFQALAKELTLKQKKAERLLKQFEGNQELLAKPATGDSAKTETLLAQSQSIASYLKYPLDTEQAAFVESLQPGKAP